jgi:hypothetical protein
METSFALYKQAAVWNPDGYTKPLLLATQGKYEVITTEPGKRVIGKSQTPIIWKFDDRYLKDTVFPEFIEPVFKAMLPMIDYLPGNDDALFKKIENKTKLVDVQYETENLIPTDKPVMFRDRMEVVIGMDNEFRSIHYKRIQNEITEHMRRLKMDPDPTPIGYGFFDKDGDSLKLVRRPNRYFRVGYYSVLEMDLIKEDLPKRDQIRVASYTYLAAYALMKFVKGADSRNLNYPSDWCAKDEKDVTTWTIHDFAAIVTLLLSGIVGFSDDVPKDREYSASDIEGMLDTVFGFGYSISNRVLWDSDEENFANYYAFCLMLAFAASRIKPQIKEYEWAKVQGRGNERAGELLNDANHGTYEGIGSMSNIYLPMPRNDGTFRGKALMPIPVICDTREIGSEKGRLEQANYIKILRQYHPVSFTSVTIDRGEIPPNTIDYTSTSQKWMMFRPTTDARIVEEEFEWRDVTKYKFPRWGIVRNGIPDKSKRILFTIGLMMNGDQSLKDGIPIKVSMNILQPVKVAVYRTKMLETAIIKENSDTETDVSRGIIQKPKPTAGMTGAAMISNEKDQSTEVPRPGTKKDPVPDKHVSELPNEADITNSVPSESEPSDAQDANQVQES